MKAMKQIGLAVIIFGVSLGLNTGHVLAQEHGSGKKAKKSGHPHDSAAIHGGSVTMTQQHHFEVIFYEKELRVYAYTGKQEPILDIKGVSGSVLLNSKNGDALTVKLSYVAPDSSHESAQGYLSGKHDFSGVKKGTMRATFSIEGLSNPKESSVTFRESVRLYAGDDSKNRMGHKQGGHQEKEGH